MHPFEMTRALIDMESITENEKQVGEYLLHYLSGLAAGSGGKAEAMAVSPERFNVYAEWGSSRRCAFDAYGYGAAVHRVAAKMKKIFTGAARAMPRESSRR